MAEQADRLEDRLLADFEDSTIRDGRAYLARGAVLELVVNDMTLTALVQGTRASPYCVSIDVDEESGLPKAGDGDCTCPTRLKCKHAAAAILAFAGRRADGPSEVALDPDLAAASTPLVVTRRDRALNQISHLLDRKAERRETTVPLDPPSDSTRSPWTSSYLDPRPGPEPRADRWRLVFAVAVEELKEGGIGPAGASARHRSVLFPALQYMAKTGEPGRIEKYRPDRLTEPPQAEESHLLGRLVANGGRAPLLAHWDYLLEHPGILLLVSDGEGRPIAGIVPPPAPLRPRGRGGEPGGADQLARDVGDEAPRRARPPDHGLDGRGCPLCLPDGRHGHRAASPEPGGRPGAAGPVPVGSPGRYRPGRPVPGGAPGLGRRLYASPDRKGAVVGPPGGLGPLRLRPGRRGRGLGIRAPRP